MANKTEIMSLLHKQKRITNKFYFIYVASISLTEFNVYTYFMSFLHCSVSMLMKFLKPYLLTIICGNKT